MSVWSDLINVTTNPLAFLYNPLDLFDSTEGLTRDQVLDLYDTKLKEKKALFEAGQLSQDLYEHFVFFVYNKRLEILGDPDLALGGMSIFGIVVGTSIKTAKDIIKAFTQVGAGSMESFKWLGIALPILLVIILLLYVLPLVKK